MTVGETNIKLQIWDTVFRLIFRQVKSHLSLLLEDTIDLLLELFWFMILQIENRLIMFQNGCKKQKLMEMLKCALLWLVINVIWTLSKFYDI